MERGGGDGGDSDGCSPSQHQNTIWKHFQARAKPLLSPKLGSREPEEKKERGGWMFKKMRRKENLVLDRIISSSQPDLLFSQVDLEAREAQLCAKAAAKLASSKLHSGGPDKPTLAQLVQSHHKSSSLGSACLDRLAEPPGGSGGRGGGVAATAAAAAAGAPLESSDEQRVRCGTTCQMSGGSLMEVFVALASKQTDSSPLLLIYYRNIREDPSKMS